ncbi:MAG: hypothetical protein KDA53_06930 [Hyphomonas sp.]|nr:hypothetical protein [Hyphomonas sp.]
MPVFTPSEIDEIDALWRSLPPDHMWTGWASAGEAPEQVWIFRTRAHWRRFPLVKTGEGYALSDEKGRRVIRAATLEDLLSAVEAIPALGTRRG